MKKSVLTITLSMMLVLSGLTVVNAQEQPKPQKDTVNLDTNAKPEKYYAVEDEKSDVKGSKSSATTIIIIVAAVIVVGTAAFFLLKKKK